MTGIEEFDRDAALGLEGFFFDIDDTFSTRGKILPSAYGALWDLHDAGLKMVPITGRPAGWCDHFARMWPVEGIVGENGAFYFWMDKAEKRLKKRFFDEDALRGEKRERLKALAGEILKEVPGTALASDQGYREADLAVDFCEDVPPLEWGEIEKICRIFERHGATYKVSSIHVNGWFGDYSKLTMTRNFARERWGMDLDLVKDRFLYLGDSPNDEPMFRYFPNAVGVKNVLDFEGRMEHWPAYVAGKEGGEGFAQAAEVILRLRNR